MADGAAAERKPASSPANKRFKIAGKTVQAGIRLSRAKAVGGLMVSSTDGEVMFEPETTETQTDARRAELAKLRIGELKKLARAAEADMLKVEQLIDDSDDPRTSVAELVLAAEAARDVAPAPEEKADDALTEAQGDKAVAAVMVYMALKVMADTATTAVWPLLLLETYGGIARSV